MVMATSWGPGDENDHHGPINHGPPSPGKQNPPSKYWNVSLVAFVSPFGSGIPIFNLHYDGILGKTRIPIYIYIYIYIYVYISHRIHGTGIFTYMKTIKINQM